MEDYEIEMKILDILDELRSISVEYTLKAYTPYAFGYAQGIRDTCEKVKRLLYDNPED